MTERTKANIIELYDGGKDKEQQIKLMASMGFGTKREIIEALHESGRALDITIRKPARKTEQTEDPQKPTEEKRILPIPQDVKQLLLDQLEDIDKSIKELEEEIQVRDIEKRKLESLYQHVVEVLSQ